jgi:predicted acyl esterase
MGELGSRSAGHLSRAACLIAALSLLLVAGLPATATATLASLKAACTDQHPTDAPTLTYKKCDDGVPQFGGRTPNPGSANALPVPASYRWGAGQDPLAGVAGADPTVDALPPADTGATASNACLVPGADLSAAPACTVALDADVFMPTTSAPTGGYPLIVMMHGCCSGNKTSWESNKLAEGGERWHYNAAWFATHGYVVLTYTARGFVDQNNHGSTGETQIDSLQYEMNDFQALAGMLADDASFNVNPQKVVASGGSYGGGFSWLALVDPKWKSYGGKDMKLAAVTPRYGWTDLVDSLVPTGRHFYDFGSLPATDGSDSGLTPTGGSRQEVVGIPKRSIVAALYLSGATGVPPGNHATFPQSVHQAFQCTQNAYPLERDPGCLPTITQVLPDFIRYRSAYYWKPWFSRIASDSSLRVPIWSAGTFTDPLFPPVEHRRMVNRIRAAVPDYPVQEYYGDYNHFVQNKAKEWGDVCQTGTDRHVCQAADYTSADQTGEPANIARPGATTRLDRFVDFYAKGSGAQPAFDVTAAAQVCANKPDGQVADEPGPTFTAPSFSSLTPGVLDLDFIGAQTTTNKAAPNQHALQADPVANTASNGSKCIIHSDAAGPGVATYESRALPSDATMLGGGIVSVKYTATGTDGLELNARLYDVFPDGDAVMVDRAPRRIDPARDGTTSVTFQLHGNGWRFKPGHKLRLELAQDDSPYLHESDVPSSLSLSAVHLHLPLRETTYGTAPGNGPGGGGEPGGGTGSGACATAADHFAPTARMSAPRLASDRSTTPRFRIGWSGSDIGCGIKSFRVEYRRLRTGVGAGWHGVPGSSGKTSATFAGRYGATYEFRVTATDRSGNRSRVASATTIVPTAVRTRGARYSGPWRVRASRDAFGRRLIGCSSRACSLAYSYRGGDIVLLGATGADGGKLLVSLDGHRGRVIDLYSAKRGGRRIVFRAHARAGSHVLHVRVLARRRAASRGTTVRLDGFGVRALR